VALELEHVFTGKGVWCRKKKRKAIVQDFAVGTAEGRNGRLSWRRQATQDVPGDAGGRRSGEANDADAATTAGGRDGGDGVARRRAQLILAPIVRLICHCWAMERRLLTTQ